MASSLVGVTVSATGHEKEYYRAIKNHILGISSIFTCDNDPDDEFDYGTNGDDHIATLSFKINNVYSFKLYRPDVLKRNSSEVGVYAINFAMDVNEQVPSSSGHLRFKFGDYGMNDPVAQSVDLKRGLIISHFIGDNFVLLCFSPAAYSWSGQGNSDTKRLVRCSSGSTTIVASSIGGVSGLTEASMFNVSEMSFYNLASPSVGGVFLSRFTYAAPPGQIDYIKSSIYQNAGSKVIENMAIYDSSTVSVGSTVSLKDGSYFAVGSHQLVKCS